MHIAFLKYICYFCCMTDSVGITLIQRAKDLPQMNCLDFFHSTDFFKMLENTPRQQPYMVIARNAGGHIIAHLLANITYHRIWIPPFVYPHGRVYGEGEYADGVDKERVFGLMLHAITQKLSSRGCIYIEFSDLSAKMFAYRHFRLNGYFPIRWQEIHNSLHSKHPKERLSARLLKKIDEAHKRGVTTYQVNDEKQLTKAYQLLRNHFRFKSRRSVPNCMLFRQMLAHKSCHIYITQYKEKVIGCCVCIDSGDDTYMWYLASLKKTFLYLHPNLLTVWNAMTFAYTSGHRHFRFMDAGLPVKHTPSRMFIMEFGGKPVSKFRWFRLPIPWLNHILAWCYND